MILTFVRGSFFQMQGKLLFNGQPVDARAWSLPRVVLANFNGTEVFAELNVEWVDPAIGQLRAWAESAETKVWPVGRARIDAQVVDGFGNTYNSLAEYLRITESMLNVLDAQGFTPLDPITNQPVEEPQNG